MKTNTLKEELRDYAGHIKEFLIRLSKNEIGEFGHYNKITAQKYFDNAVHIAKLLRELREE